MTRPFAMPRFVALFLVFIMSMPVAAQAQEYLTQAEMNAILADNGLCYDANAAGECLWSERYHRFDGPLLVSRLGQMVGPGQQLVVEIESTWIADAICIRDGDVGIVRSFFSPDAAFYFDYRAQVEQTLDVTQEAIRAFSEGVLSKTCFRFARDVGNSTRLVQHTFADGVLQNVENLIGIVPLSQSSTRLSPSAF